MPRKNFLLPLVAAARTALRWRSLFKMGRQKEWGCSPPSRIQQKAQHQDLL